MSQNNNKFLHLSVTLDCITELMCENEQNKTRSEFEKNTTRIELLKKLVEVNCDIKCLN